MSQGKQKTKSKSATQNLVDLEEDSEHELFYYAGNRIQLMKEVLKLIKPKKIKQIAPTFMKNLDIEEINSMLLEELLGISNKRLKRILNGENLDEESSSSESEEDKPIDVISLDDISDDDFRIIETNDSPKKAKQKNKKVPKPIKKEKTENKKGNSASDKVASEGENEKLMSVLEILELQARARAIRSQLALENMSKKQSERSTSVNVKEESSSDESDAIIVDSPKNDEILITSSESESELGPKESQDVEKVISVGSEEAEKINSGAEHQQTPQNEKTSEDKKDKEVADRNNSVEAAAAVEKNIPIETNLSALKQNSSAKSDSDNDDVINLDIEEMEND